MKVYADNAATTALSQKALESLQYHYKNTYGNPSGLYEMAQVAKEVLENARETIAKCLGCTEREIYFTSCGSESDNQAIFSTAMLGAKKNKKHIVSSKFEHHAVLHTLQNLQREFGFEVTYLDVYENGMVRPEDLEQAIRPDTCLVTIMYANNEIGTIQPIEALASIAKKHGVYFHTDAVQAVGHLPINLAESNIDMLSFSAHKFHGPKGVGALYVRKGAPLRPYIFGGAQENNKRAGTENVPQIAAMAVALEEAVGNMQAHNAKMQELRDYIQAELLKISHSKVNGQEDSRLAGILNMCFEGVEGEGMLLYLDDMGVCVSSGSACTSGSLDPSHVLMAMGLPHDIAHGSLRISLSALTTKEEAEHIVACVPQVINKIRQMSPVWKDLEEGIRKHVI